MIPPHGGKNDLKAWQNEEGDTMSTHGSSEHQTCPWCGTDRLFLEDTISRLEVEVQSLRGALGEVAHGSPPPDAQLDTTTWLRRRARFALGEDQSD